MATSVPVPPQVLPIVVFFSTVMSVLYYVGLMQWIIRKVLGCRAVENDLSLLNSDFAGVHLADVELVQSKS